MQVSKRSELLNRVVEMCDFCGGRQQPRVVGTHCLSRLVNHEYGDGCNFR